MMSFLLFTCVVFTSFSIDSLLKNQFKADDTTSWYYTYTGNMHI